MDVLSVADLSYEECVALVKQRESEGTLFLAYDFSERALEDERFRGDVWLRHRAVLNLARAGAIEAAQTAFESYGLEAEAENPEVAALRARLIKSRALRAGGAARSALLGKAAEAYQVAHAVAPSYYCAVNAATLWLLSGREARARTLAADAIGSVEREPATDDDLESYYRFATLAEACLVLGEEGKAAAALEQAGRFAAGDLAARGTTRKQLRLLLEHRGLDRRILDPLAPPAVMHYCGHMMSPPGQAGRMVTDDEARVRAGIEKCLDALSPGIAYGALASGADLLFAEALLARGAEVTAVLPFDVDDFVRTSVRPAGPRWEQRFWQSFERIRTDGRVIMATEDEYLGDDNLFTYADEFAMGLAILRARNIDAHVEQLTVWDGLETAGVAGTFVSRQAWSATGLPQTNVSWEPGGYRPSTTAAAPEPRVARERRALLFGDFKHFSRIPDRHLPAFVERVLGRVKEVIDRHRVLCSNTWGDAIYLVLEDAEQAVGCALDLQESVKALDWPGMGFDPPLQLRLGGHYGPVYHSVDPVLGTMTYFGAHVSRAARVEPITPPGGVYVTEQFATKLVLSSGRAYECEYVGIKNAPKGYGRLPLSLVRPVAVGVD